jgi:hypothetical protein
MFYAAHRMFAAIGGASIALALVLIVNYGGNGNKTSEKIASLLPGEKVLLSPPENSPLKSVTVTTDQGLIITKGYRTPIKIPGMMGA